MTYAKVINGEIVENNRTLPFSTTTTSFGTNTSAEIMATFGYLPVVGSEPVHDSATHRVNGVSYVVGAIEVTKVYSVVAIPIEEIIATKTKAAESAVQAHINSVVVGLGYDNENSIAKYLVAENPFYIECKAISLWIGAVWVSAYTIQTQVAAGTISEPTTEELVAMLPVYGV